MLDPIPAKIIQGGQKMTPFLYALTSSNINYQIVLNINYFDNRLIFDDVKAYKNSAILVPTGTSI